MGQPEPQTFTVLESKSTRHAKSKTSRNSWGSMPEWRLVLAELVSTALLVLLGCMSCLPLEATAREPLYGPFGFGLVVMFCIQTFGHISGAHMNPCVTLASVIWEQTPLPLGISYFIAQCLGSVVGYGLLLTLSPIDATQAVCVTAVHPNLTEVQGFAIETFLTAGLCFLCCAVWDPVNEHGVKETCAIKFGFVVAGFSIVGGPMTGASMNPARSLGPALWTGSWAAHWVYWAGPMLGAVVSTLLYKYVWLSRSPKPTYHEEAYDSA